MASLGNMKITHELRPCLVNGKKALFHTWEHYSVGDIKNVAGIIEAENGQVVRVCPSSIKFLDNKIEEYCFNDAIKERSVEDILYKFICEGCSECCNCYENGRQRECEHYNEHYKWMTAGSSQEV